MKPYVKPKTVTDLREAGRIILAHGEVTGHSHEIQAIAIDGVTMPSAEFFEEPDTGRRVLLALVDQPFPLTHQEHATVMLDPAAPAQVRQGDVFLNPIGKGAWEVIRQREYAPAAIRNVAD